MTTTAATPMSTTTADDTRRPAHSPAILWVELRDELLGILREPAALFFSVLMPVMFFAMFTGLFGTEQTPGSPPAGTIMLATFGAFGVIGAAMLNPGIGLAEARERGWLRVLRTSPVPVPVTLAAKVVATLPYSLGILVAMTATAAGFGVLEVTVTEWLLLAGALVIGSLPFSFIGLIVGSFAPPNATTAILNAIVIPMAIASGLWFPLEIMPAWVGAIAPWMPAYHLAELALTPITTGGSALDHVAALVGLSVVGIAAATFAYRRSST